MAISESQRKAVRKYNQKAYDRLEISVTKGKKADLQTHAENKGESLNGFVNRAIDNQIRRDTSDYDALSTDEDCYHFKVVVDAIGEISAAAKEKIFKGRLSISNRYLASLYGTTQDKLAELAKDIAAGRYD